MLWRSLLSTRGTGDRTSPSGAEISLSLADPGKQHAAQSVGPTGLRNEQATAVFGITLRPLSIWLAGLVEFASLGLGSPHFRPIWRHDQNLHQPEPKTAPQPRGAP